MTTLPRTDQAFGHPEFVVLGLVKFYTFEKKRMGLLEVAQMQEGKPQIVQSARNRPRELGKAQADPKVGAVMHKVVEAGIEPRAVANQVFADMAEGKFYILTHPEMMPAIYIRHKDISEGRLPRGTFAKAYLKR